MKILTQKYMYCTMLNEQFHWYTMTVHMYMYNVLCECTMYICTCMHMQNWAVEQINLIALKCIITYLWSGKREMIVVQRYWGDALEHPSWIRSHDGNSGVVWGDLSHFGGGREVAGDPSSNSNRLCCPTHHKVSTMNCTEYMYRYMGTAAQNLLSTYTLLCTWYNFFNPIENYYI